MLRNALSVLWGIAQRLSAAAELSSWGCAAVRAAAGPQLHLRGSQAAATADRSKVMRHQMATLRCETKPILGSRVQPGAVERLCTDGSAPEAALFRDGGVVLTVPAGGASVAGYTYLLRPSPAGEPCSCCRRSACSSTCIMLARTAAHDLHCSVV